jgi:hypothetical protein
MEQKLLTDENMFLTIRKLPEFSPRLPSPKLPTSPILRKPLNRRRRSLYTINLNMNRLNHTHLRVRVQPKCILRR